MAAAGGSAALNSIFTHTSTSHGGRESPPCERQTENMTEGMQPRGPREALAVLVMAMMTAGDRGHRSEAIFSAPIIWGRSRSSLCCATRPMVVALGHHAAGSEQATKQARVCICVHYRDGRLVECGLAHRHGTTFPGVCVSLWTVLGGVRHLPPGMLFGLRW